MNSKITRGNERSQPWLTHTLICSLHSTHHSFVIVTTDLTYQRQVDHDKSIPIDTLQRCWDIFENIKLDLRLSLAISTPRTFSNPPGSYQPTISTTPTNIGDNYILKIPRVTDRNRKRPFSADKQKEWLIADGCFSFPCTLSVTPWKKFSCDDRQCIYGRICFLLMDASPRITKKLTVYWLMTGSKRSKECKILESRWHIQPSKVLEWNQR